MGDVEEYGRGREMWWEGWRGMGEVEECGGRDEVCGGRDKVCGEKVVGVWWEWWTCVEGVEECRGKVCGGGVEGCGGRDEGEFGRGCVWMGKVSRMGLVPFLNFWIPCCQMFAVSMCLCVW